VRGGTDVGPDGVLNHACSPATSLVFLVAEHHSGLSVLGVALKLRMRATLRRFMNMKATTTPTTITVPAPTTAPTMAPIGDLLPGVPAAPVTVSA
jgi:hypothetical protein